MTFRSHGPEKPKLLEDHLIYVGERAQKLASCSSFASKDVAYYAGLFHDIGKLNPYYQKLFCGEDKEELSKKYHDFHSPYSCWFTKYLLKQTTLSRVDRNRVMMIIDGHHGKMKNTPGNYFGDEKRKPQTVKEILKNWNIFKNSCKNKIKELDFDIMPSCDKMKYDKLLKLKPGEDVVDAFLECGYFFSCVLQADRGSFSDFEEIKLDDNFMINTEKLATKNTLSDFRNSFQSEVQKNIDTTNPINVINAPTGTGKTKAFLDLIKKYKPDRVFYFSPLLALTDNIGDKLSDVCDSTDEILVYHHIFTGSLKQKNTADKDTTDEDTKNEPYKWNFDYDAFNEKIVITTTQRLLMILYSDAVNNKIKLASFRNSLLIIDEVQTLPKFLLKNMIKILQSMNHNLNTKTLLVSATIPHELLHLPKVVMNPKSLQEYQKEKNRTITKSNTLEIDKIKKSNTLIMFNTRKEAKEKYNQLDVENKHYISSGLTKNHRNKILSNLSKKDSVLVSTQVVEAGVDISFDQIWRQMAPIDNIIQVMGRLDRESNNKSSTLHLFDVDTAKYTPYSSLEFMESQNIIQDISNSMQLYEKLDSYYDTISTKNKTQKDLETNLNDSMSRLDFKDVWQMIQKHIGENFYDSVFIPLPETWNDIKSDLLSKSKYRIKKHAGLTALLPAKAFTMQEFFDEELYENNILYPKKEKIEELYDKEIGLDKWIK